MPCYYEIYPDLNIVKIVYRRQVSPREILDLLDALGDDPGYTCTIDELIVFDRYNGRAITPEARGNLHNLIRGLLLLNNSAKRIAIVAPEEPGRTIGRMFVDLMQRDGKISVRIFDTVRQAMGFLGPSELRLMPAEGAEH